MRRLLFALVLSTSLGFCGQCLAQRQLIINPYVKSHVPLPPVEVDEVVYLDGKKEKSLEVVERHKIPFVFKADGLYLAPVGEAGVSGNVRKIEIEVEKLVD
ncbi:MAG: hypothetical protein AAF497_06140 [Planctomycetota bacterium]